MLKVKIMSRNQVDFDIYVFNQLCYDNHLCDNVIDKGYTDSILKYKHDTHEIGLVLWNECSEEYIYGHYRF